MLRRFAPLVADLWQHRRLLWQFTLRNVELRHKGSHLGLVWSFLGPLLMLGLYVLVFGFIFDGKLKADAAEESRVDYALAVFLGLAIHHFLAEVMTLSPTIVVAQPNFVKKVVFPLAILPAAGVGAALVHFLITLGLVFLGALLAGSPVAWGTLAWLPVILLPLVLGALGLGFLFSSIGVFWRDLVQIAQFLSLALLFASAVFYPVAKIPAEAWTYLRFNPLIHWIEEARHVAFWGHPPSPTHVAYTYAVSLGLFAAGGWVFQKLRSSFADVL
ncbi:MAG TPA: ABC transporter permease [Opitutaceae bacterium]|nr:ABC transporter permease [Opitutaceae bacterium]